MVGSLGLLMRVDSTWDKEPDKFSLGALKKNNGRNDGEKLLGGKGEVPVVFS